MKEGTNVTTSTSSIQYSLDQFKRQQVIQQKQIAQIEDMKKRILMNTWAKENQPE